jgi:hypothetical protein
MKKSSLILISILVMSSSVWAQTTETEEAASVECSTNPLFTENTCDVCYTQALEAGETGVEITDITIPWEYKSEGDLSEIIYSNEQAYPEVKSTLAVTTSSEKPEEVWENDETLKWEPFEAAKESVLAKGQKVGLYRLMATASLKAEAAKADDEILLVTPLTYHEFNTEISEESAAKKRNICVLGTVIAKAGTTTTTDEPAPEVTPELIPDETTTIPETPAEEPLTDSIKIDAPELNAAAEEPQASVEEQTEVKTGPGLWIALLLAFVLASSWQAYQKQKNV